MRTAPVKHALPWLLLVLSAAVVVWLSATGQDAFSITLAAVAICLVGIGPAAGWARRSPGEACRRGAVVAAWCVLLLSVGMAHWPLRAAFALARPGLEEAAGRVAHGAPAAGPFRAGPFRVLHAESVSPHTVCLWIGLDGGGRTGLVRHAGPARDVPLNLWTSVKLDERWQFVHED